ncbi:MAG: hypothetical protein NE334_08490 [Lentisphaeraceae bacterium]|nr:hypothetical protein [Lentisphaeraceae bacterium]
MFKCILISVLLLAGSLTAQTTLKGSFEFAKKPPYGAVVLFGEDKSREGKAGSTLDQKDKMFSKKIIVVPKDSNISFKNSDMIDHNIFADDRDSKVKFDAGLVAPGNDAKQASSWAEGTIFRVSCKIHPKMRSYVAVASSAYFAEVEFDSKIRKASFEIKAIPDSLTKVNIWLPKYEKIEVAIKKGETKTVELKKPGKTTIYGKVTLTR